MASGGNRRSVRKWNYLTVSVASLMVELSAPFELFEVATTTEEMELVLIQPQKI